MKTRAGTKQGKPQTDLSKMNEQKYDIRCPIHVSIGLTELEKKILDHPLMQRLRYISQLGLASLVFPSANHSRFSHSLGVMHLAGKIFTAAWQKGCQIDPKLKGKEFNEQYFLMVVRLAGLLHDLGHPPFSHTCEKLLLESYSSDVAKKISHESCSVDMIEKISADMPGDFSKELAGDVCSLISDGKPSAKIWHAENKHLCVHPFLKQVIAGEIDADRMDYLRRDAYFTGTYYGFFDTDRLIEGLACLWEKNKGWVMGLEYNNLQVYENFLVARIHMTTQVYFNKTILGFNRCLEKALGCKEVKLSINAENFLQAREDHFWDLLHQAAEKHEKKNGNTSFSWSQRLVRRKPLKLLLHQHMVAGDDSKPSWVEVACDKLKESKIPFHLVKRRQKLSKQNQPEETKVRVYREWLGERKFYELHEISSLLQQSHNEFSFWGIFCEPEGGVPDRALEILKKSNVVAEGWQDTRGN